MEIILLLQIKIWFVTWLMTALLTLGLHWLNKYQTFIKVFSATWNMLDWIYILRTSYWKIISYIDKSTKVCSNRVWIPCFKVASEILIKPFTHICNLSLSQGIFPSQLKTANVIPLYKSDDPMLFKSYRTVSVMCVLSWLGYHYSMV